MSKALLPRLPPDRKQFFTSHTLTQLAIWYHTASALRNVSDAVGAVGRKEYSLAGQQAEAGAAQIEALLAAERRGEGVGSANGGYGVWAGWHLHDWLDGFSSLRDVLRQLAQVCTAKAAIVATVNGTSPVDAGTIVQTRPFRFGTGSWNSFFQYETVPQHADGDAYFPFFYPHPDTNWGSFAHAVRIMCDGSCCLDNVIGGNLNCTGAGAAVGLHSVRAGSHGGGDFVRYTVANGTSAAVPTVSSTVFNGEPVLL